MLYEVITQAAHVGLFTLALYGGYHLYLRALEKAGDPLNGILIIVITSYSIHYTKLYE